MSDSGTGAGGGGGASPGELATVPLTDQAEVVLPSPNVRRVFLLCCVCLV